MHYNIFTTTNCNLNCRYCTDGSNKNKKSPGPSYSIKDLKSFLEQDKNLMITFYGGEPLLNPSLIKKIMDNIPAREFMLQTNGTLLDKLPVSYINRFHTILLSIDGDEILTDYYRGIGTYKKALANARWIKNKGFPGELIARLTVDEKTDIEKQLNHLMGLNLFDSYHWQLNMCFYDRHSLKSPASWVYNFYNPGINNLIDKWTEKIKTGKVIKIYPFIGIMNSLINKESSPLRCGAGHSFFNILPDGSVSPCPNLRKKEFTKKNILENNSKEIENFHVKEPCPSCSYYSLCGGRCLVANLLNPWGEEGFNLVCETVKNMIDKLIEVKPQIEEAIKEGRVSIKDFKYTRYNGCEIIP